LRANNIGFPAAGQLAKPLGGFRFSHTEQNYFATVLTAKMRAGKSARSLGRKPRPLGRRFAQKTGSDKSTFHSRDLASCSACPVVKKRKALKAPLPYTLRDADGLMKHVGKWVEA
jgi:hypothetical protein